MKLVLRWYLSGFYKKPKVSACWGGMGGGQQEVHPAPPGTHPCPQSGVRGTLHPPGLSPQVLRDRGPGPDFPPRDSGRARPPGRSRSLKGPSWASTPQRNGCDTAAPGGDEGP